LGVSEPPNPEPIDMKFGVSDYVGDITLHAKIQKDRHSGVSQRMGEISLSRGL